MKDGRTNMFRMCFLGLQYLHLGSRPHKKVPRKKDPSFSAPHALPLWERQRDSAWLMCSSSCLPCLKPARLARARMSVRQQTQPSPMRIGPPERWSPWRLKHSRLEAQHLCKHRVPVQALQQRCFKPSNLADPASPWPKGFFFFRQRFDVKALARAKMVMECRILEDTATLKSEERSLSPPGRWGRDSAPFSWKVLEAWWI